MIQSSLGDVNARISTLENNARLTSSANAPVASTSDQVREQQHHQAPLDDVMSEFTPRRTLATAVPVSNGQPFFPPAAAISHQLRSQILAGNNINLVKILLGSELCDRRVVDCGDISVALKDADPRLSKR